MKLELMYECDPTLYGDEDDYISYDTDLSQGVFDTYEQLLEWAVSHWDYRAYYALYIRVPDDERWEVDTKKKLDELNERFREDLLRSECEKKQKI